MSTTQGEGIRNDAALYTIVVHVQIINHDYESEDVRWHDEREFHLQDANCDAIISRMFSNTYDNNANAGPERVECAYVWYLHVVLVGLVSFKFYLLSRSQCLINPSGGWLPFYGARSVRVIPFAVAPLLLESGLPRVTIQPRLRRIIQSASHTRTHTTAVSAALKNTISNTYRYEFAVKTYRGTLLKL